MANLATRSSNVMSNLGISSHLKLLISFPSLYMNYERSFLDFCSQMFTQIFLKDIIDHTNLKNIDVD